MHGGFRVVQGLGFRSIHVSGWFRNFSVLHLGRYVRASFSYKKAREIPIRGNFRRNPAFCFVLACIIHF